MLRPVSTQENKHGIGTDRNKIEPALIPGRPYLTREPRDDSYIKERCPFLHTYGSFLLFKQHFPAVVVEQISNQDKH